MKVKSFSAYSPTELEQQLDKLKSDGFQATLSIVFATKSIDFQEIQSVFRQSGIDMVGCSSAGEIVDATVQEHGMACMVFDMDRSYYRIFEAETGDSSTYQISFEAGLEAKNAFANPALLLLSGGIQVDAERLVFGVKDGVGREIPFFGGLAGDDLQLERTFTFSNNMITTDGIVCVILDNDKIEIKGLATSGWEAIGTVNTVTRAKGNILETINDQPALDVFLKHFGFFDNTSHKGEPITSLSAQYPLQLMRDNDVSVLRSPLFADYENRSLILAGGVREGEQFRFSIAPGFEVVEKTVEEFTGLAQKLPMPDAAILFSCKGRHAALGPVIEEEIEGLFNHWKAPMIGFFTYGEIGNTKSGICEFHNETCSLVLLKEKNEA